MESVTEYASQKLLLAVMVNEHPNNLMYKEDFEELERSTIYNSLRPRIQSLVTTEYNPKVDIWTLYIVIWDKDTPDEDGNE